MKSLLRIKCFHFCLLFCLHVLKILSEIRVMLPLNVSFEAEGFCCFGDSKFLESLKLKLAGSVSGSASFGGLQESDVCWQHSMYIFCMPVYSNMSNIHFWWMHWPKIFFVAEIKDTLLTCNYNGKMLSSERVAGSQTSVISICLPPASQMSEYFWNSMKNSEIRKIKKWENICRQESKIIVEHAFDNWIQKMFYKSQKNNKICDIFSLAFKT